MIFLLLAIISSSSMALILKCFRAQRGNRYGIILGNYMTCILLSVLLLPDKSLIASGSRVTLICGIIGGIFFVAGLVCMQSSIPVNGASLTSAFSRLGLLVSLAVSILWFKERPETLQLAGIALVLISIVLIRGDAHSEGHGDAHGDGHSDAHSAEHNDGQSGSGGYKSGAGQFSVVLLLLTLLSCGSGDAMAKVFEQFGDSREDALYFFWLFLVAAALSFLLLMREKKKTGKKVAVSEMTAGILVGIPNYFSSYFLLRALEQFPASLAFSVFSTGSILLVTAVSALLFGERLSKRQIAAMGVILAALVLLNI